MGKLRKNDKLKLVYILPKYDPDIGSHFFHIYELLERASAHIDIFLVIEKAEGCPAFKHLAGIYVQRFSWHPLRYAELWAVLLWLRLKGWKKFWVHYSFIAGLAALDVTSILRGKVYYWNCGMPWLYGRGALEEFIFRFVMKHSYFVTGTKGLKKMYIEHYGLKEKKVKVMPNWVNIERFEKWRGKKKEARKELNIPADKKVALFVHHLSKRKGADRIVPIARQFRDDNTVLFIIVGTGPYAEALKAEVRNGRLKNILLVGEIPNRDIPKYLAAADVFFMPSREEGFPRVLLEAMAVGTPFVASNVGSVREIVPEVLQNYLTRPRDVRDQWRKIQMLFVKDKQSDFSKLLQFHVQQYDLWSAVSYFVQIVS